MNLLLVLACTFTAGGGFADVTSATLDASLEPGEARDLGGGSLLTDEGHEVALDTLFLALGSLTLQELSGGESVDFDPADPPEGYTLCHGGHCHAEDGSLASYAEIEAELAGGSATLVDVATFPVDATADLLGGETYALVRPGSPWRS